MKIIKVITAVFICSIFTSINIFAAQEIKEQIKNSSSEFSANLADKLSAEKENLEKQNITKENIKVVKLDEYFNVVIPREDFRVVLPTNLRKTLILQTNYFNIFKDYQTNEFTATTNLKIKALTQPLMIFKISITSAYIDVKIFKDISLANAKIVLSYNKKDNTIDLICEPQKDIKITYTIAKINLNQSIQLRKYYSAKNIA